MSSQANIAIITAANPLNSGMYSVDLAAMSLFSQLGMKHTFFLPQAKKKRLFKYIPLLNSYNLRFGNIRHKLLSSAQQLEEFTHIIYWGDFLNNPRYGRLDFSPRDVAFGHSSTKAEAYKRWAEIFALVDQEPSAHVLAVGGNFQHAFDESEAGVLSSFLKKADLVLPRDPRSFNNLKPLLSHKTVLSQGMDCAFLLPPLASHLQEGKYFCYEFGRSSLPNIEQLISSIEAATGLRGFRLPKWLHLKHQVAHKEFSKQREFLAKAQFVITDIYHLSINTLNCDTPVFCLGRAASEQTGTLGDYKKQALFSMLGLKDHYFEATGDCQSAYKSVIYAIKNRSGRVTLEWRERLEQIDQMKETFRSKLIAAL